MEGNDLGLLMEILKNYPAEPGTVAINTVKTAVIGVEIQARDLPTIKQSFRYGGPFSKKVEFFIENV
jgi:hypothetical protein